MKLNKLRSHLRSGSRPHLQVRRTDSPASERRYMENQERLHVVDLGNIWRKSLKKALPWQAATTSKTQLTREETSLDKLIRICMEMGSWVSRRDTGDTGGGLEE
ncbi:uncharacterized protein LOC120457475 isoform X2 [Drosophila santomea]|uniref:uncharacterized protein LOC120457475 isoform X2 n=1 Tax=Drosophila santomea TaxID=129105 RepID=UPI0019531F9A|nr:uncharacterized protein LOC120457475 isoform X2 [Drosophila santomea]